MILQPESSVGCYRLFCLFRVSSHFDVVLASLYLKIGPPTSFSPTGNSFASCSAWFPTVTHVVLRLLPLSHFCMLTKQEAGENAAGTTYSFHLVTHRILAEQDPCFRCSVFMAATALNVTRKGRVPTSYS